MKKLQDQFVKSGWTHDLKHSDGPWRIYERSKADVPAHFELIKARVSTAEVVDGQWVKDGEPHEVYPSNEQWGLYGFTFQTMEKALDRLENIKNSTEVYSD